MATLKDTIAYICVNYPHKNELSKARLTKMLYLSDWQSNVKRGKSITEVEWYFNHYGPYVDDIVNEAYKDSGFSVVVTKNVYGDEKHLIKYDGEEKWDSLSETDIKILDDVIGKTSKMYWNSFINYVYSTYPIKIQKRYDKLNLKEISERFKDLQEKEGVNEKL